MRHRKKLIMINWHRNTSKLNGPLNIYYNLSEAILKLNNEIIEITPEKFDYSLEKAIIAVFKYCFKERDNVILVNENGFMMPIIVLFISLFSRKNNYFLLTHGIIKIEDKYLKVKHKKYYVIEKIVQKAFPNIICVSSFLKEKIVEYSKRKKTLHVLNNGINREYITQYSYKSKTPEIKFVLTGGLKRIKGLKEIMECVHTVNARDKEYKCYLEIYGNIDDDTILDEFNDFLSKNYEEEYIEYKGIIDKEELHSKYLESNFNVSLSWFDTFNMSVLEGMSTGTPSILSNQCGACDIIDNFKNGFIIDINTNYIEQFEKILDFIWENWDEYNKIRFKAIETAKENIWESVAAKYLRTVGLVCEESI